MVNEEATIPCLSFCHQKQSLNNAQDLIKYQTIGVPMVLECVKHTHVNLRSHG